MARYRQLIENENGWTKWIAPLHGGHGRRNYHLACCDCGLVHKVQFRIIKSSSGRASQVHFRMSRQAKATAAMRAADHRGKRKP